MLALNGFEAWGLEVSQKATDSADANIKAQLAKPTDDNSGKGEGRSKPAVAEVLLGDFFERDWESQVGTDFEGFDIIYDYTVSPTSPCRPHKVLISLSFSVPCCRRCDKIGHSECRSCSHQQACLFAWSSPCGSR